MIITRYLSDCLSIFQFYIFYFVCGFNVSSVLGSGSGSIAISSSASTWVQGALDLSVALGISPKQRQVKRLSSNTLDVRKNTWNLQQWMLSDAPQLWFVGNLAPSAAMLIYSNNNSSSTAQQQQHKSDNSSNSCKGGQRQQWMPASIFCLFSSWLSFINSLPLALALALFSSFCTPMRVDVHVC